MYMHSYTQIIQEERELLPFFPFFLGPLLAQDKENCKALRSNLDKVIKHVSIVLKYVVR